LCQNLFGKCIFFTKIASSNRGAISFGVKFANPQPISVTRNIKSLFSIANRIKSSTNGLISKTLNVLVIEAFFVGIP
jgi:hypothetical protein